MCSLHDDLTGQNVSEMKQMVYLIAFGKECLEQFKVCYSTIRKHSDIDVVLLTDQRAVIDGVKVVKVNPPIPPPNADRDVNKAQYHAYFTFRTKIHHYVDLNEWDRVWYMDTDFILKADIFKTEHPGVLLCPEPGSYISDIHFSGALTQNEKQSNPYQRGINAGIYSIPRDKYGFFAYYEWAVNEMIQTSERAWLTEQHVLNMIFVRHRKSYDINLMQNIGFPAKKTTGGALHYACYPFEQKLKMMLDEVNK